MSSKGYEMELILFSCVYNEFMYVLLFFKCLYIVFLSLLYSVIRKILYISLFLYVLLYLIAYLFLFLCSTLTIHHQLLDDRLILVGCVWLSFFFFILVLHSPLFAASDRLNGIQTLFNRLRIGDHLLQSKSKRQQCESSRYLIDPDAHLKLSIGLAKQAPHQSGCIFKVEGFFTQKNPKNTKKSKKIKYFFLGFKVRILE